MTIKSVLVLASLGGFAGCGVSTEPSLRPVDLATDRARYESGQDIAVLLSNAGAHPISFSWCDLGLERLEIEGWAAMPSPPRACALALNVLEPGKQEKTPLVLDSPLPPATYRLLLPVREDFSELEDLRSAPFDVTAD